MYALILVALLILIAAYPHLRYESYVGTFPQVEYRPGDFSTGDIIMTKFEDPCIYRAKNGINIKPSISRNFTDGLMYYSQGHWTHCGVVIVLDQPYLFHMTDDIFYDHLSRRHISCRPVLVSMADMLGYHGDIYHFKRARGLNVSPAVIDHVLSTQMTFRGNSLLTVVTNGAGFRFDDKFICADLVALALQELGAWPARLPAPKIGRVDLNAIAAVAGAGDYLAPVMIITAWRRHVGAGPTRHLKRVSAY